MSTIRIFSLCGFVIFSLSQSVAGQTFKSNDADKLVKDSKLVRLNPKNKNVQFIQLRDDAKVEDKDQSIWLGKALKITQNHSFRAISKSTDQLGHTHSKYQVHYKSLPVEGSIYSIHSKEGKILSASGDYAPGNDLNETPQLSEANAFEAAIRFVNARQYRWETEKAARPQGTLVILPINVKYFLTYKYDIYALQPWSRQFIFIDANSGKVLKTLNRIMDENVIGTAETLYNGTVNMTTDFFSDHYRLRENGRGQGIETYDLNRAYDLTQAVDFTDDDNHWNTSTDFDKAAYDAHYGTEITYDYYSQKFNRNSFDNLGAKLISYVHYNVNYNNAFWDGNVMNYGDGDNITYSPFTALEVVAHELTHALTQYSAGLIFNGESGALNESFSDIFGITIDFYKHPSIANYRMGDAMSLTNTAFRDLSDPNAYNDPDTYKGTFWDQKQEVHCNSGVQNFWFYLLCEGGSGINDIGNSFQVNGIGRDKAIQIAYRNLTVYLSPNSDYSDARFYSIQSAKDLYGECSTEAAAVSAAWYAAGIGDANDCFSPGNFTAKQISRSVVSLSWIKNANNNDVLLASSTSKNIGNPENGTVYLPGSSIPGGGIVIYSGNALSFNYVPQNPGTKYYYKAWSVKSENSYSGGVFTTVTPISLNAGKDQTVVLPINTKTHLSGLYEESIPYDSLTFKWEKIKGNGIIHIDHPDSLNTIVNFNTVGNYTFQLSVNYFGLASIDTMHVVVSMTDSVTNHIFSGHHNWMGMDAKDNYVYLADLVYGFRIMDITNITNPIELSQYERFNIKFVHVEGDYAYISENENGGLTILNIKDKYHPTFESYFDIPNSGTNSDFVVKNRIIYFTSFKDGIVIIDATNPSIPVKIGEFPCAAMNIVLIDKYLYVTEKSSIGFDPFLLNISDLENPVKVTAFPKIFSYLIAPPNTIQGEYLYQCEQKLDSNFYFCIYDISNRLNPKLTGSTKISWNNCSISVLGNYAYLNDGLRIIDITDKSHPVEVSNEYATSFDQVSVKKNVIYCTRGEAFVMYKSYLSNTPPYIYAGIDRDIDSVKSILHGEVFDDGLPLGVDKSSTWSKSSGQGNMSFSDIHNINSSVSFSDTGKYVIRLTASDGELSAYDEVQLYVHFAISKQPVKQNVCENGDVEFYVEVKSKTSVIYRWYKDNLPLNDEGNIEGTNTARLILHNTKIQDEGNYYCLISNGKSFRSDMAELLVNQIPDTPVITFNTGVLQSNAINGNQWYYNDQPVPNAQNTTLIPQSDGDYFVIVTLNNCSSKLSNVISCLSTGTKDAGAGEGITVYPNPSKDIIKVVINNRFDTDFIVDICDNRGVLLKTIKKSKSETFFEVDLTNFSAGFFVLHIYDTKRSYLTKVLKR